MLHRGRAATGAGGRRTHAYRQSHLGPRHDLGHPQNPAYKGAAAFGKTAMDPVRPRLRAQRGGSLQPKKAYSVRDKPVDEWLSLPVLALVDATLFDSGAEQVQENQQRARVSQRGARYLLQGLLGCGGCRDAYDGKPISPSARQQQARS